MNSFTFSRDEPEELCQLERIVEVLKNMPFNERLAVYREISKHLRENVSVEDYERAAVLRDMQEYYKSKVLD